MRKHQNEKALLQIMQELNRIEHLKDSEALLPKRQCMCSNCKKGGHNIISCPEACRICKMSLFRDDLIRGHDGHYYPQCTQENHE